MKITELEIGTCITHDSFEFFFGNRHSTPEKLRLRFPKYQFSSIHQVHGDKLVCASLDPQIKADAHFSTQIENALLIKTADCLPIFIGFSNPQLVLGIHAGWRGIESDILTKSYKQLRETFPNIKPLVGAIGPHIGQKSFEVNRDVADRLSTATGLSLIDFTVQLSTEKFLVCLRSLAQKQFLSLGLKSNELFFAPQDTKVDSNFHSFRRDGESSGRQFSFCVLLNK